MIIGLTGTIAAGKSVVADLLKEKGFAHYTYSDILRKIAGEKSIEQTRTNLQNLGNKIKQEANNLGILSKLIIENAKEQDIIADGIRTVDEIKELRKHENAYIIAVDAPQELRYERLKGRRRKGDPLTFEQFKKIDDHENSGKTPGQEIRRCIENSDFIISNDSDIQELKTNLEKILDKIKH